MKSRIFLASIALAVFTPVVASAQSDGCRRDGNGRIIGTVVGAGGVLGNVIAGRGDKTEGSIIGAIFGAVIGNQVCKSDPSDCRRAYGYYDERGRWHATGVSASEALGYYDRNGQWVPASSVGYYDRNNQWVGGAATGYYDANGRWVAGPTRGRYDARGRWIVGDTGYANENNANWNTVEQPRYYDNNGRWQAGRAYGYYDVRGRWISTRVDNYQSNDNQYRPGMGPYDLGQMPTDISTRIIWMREYARRELTAIEAQNRQFNRDGRITQREAQMLEKRLDRLTKRFDKNWRQARNY
jgi:hypothetical protein